MPVMTTAGFPGHVIRVTIIRGRRRTWRASTRTLAVVRYPARSASAGSRTRNAVTCAESRSTRQARERFEAQSRACPGIDVRYRRGRATVLHREARAAARAVPVPAMPADQRLLDPL